MRHKSMHRSTIAALMALAMLGAAERSAADCAGASISETRQHFAAAQAFEKAGKQREALAAYVAAQEYTCEPNPVELTAAQRAAALALPLAQAAERARDFETAFRIYDEGAHFAAADRALIAWARAKPDDPSVYGQAREAFEYRASPAFQSNNKTRLGVTGAYLSDPKHLAEVQTMPAIGAERAFKTEAAAFNEEFLRDFMMLVQSRPEDQTDMAAVQRYTEAAQKFQQRWPNDLLAASRQALSLAHAWSVATQDRALSERIAAKRRERLEQRVVTLTRAYDRAPELLQAAIEYQMSMHIDDALKVKRVAAIRSQAAQLGDAAAAQQRLGLAADYYGVARLEAKAEQAREQQRQVAMTKMQPSIDAMRKQAEDMQKAFSDPQKLKELQDQARQMQQALQAQQGANAASTGKKAADLERELGL